MVATRAVLAAASGVVLSVALPPFGLWPAALALTVLFALVATSAGAREAFGLGFWFAVAFFALYILWLPQSFSQPTFLGPFFWVLFPPLLVILGVFWGIVSGLSRLLGGRGTPTLWLLPGVWVLMEWARAQGYFGFPWGTLGYLWLDTPAGQLADTVGVYGLSLLATVPAALFAVPLLSRGAFSRSAHPVGRRAPGRLASIAAPLAAAALLGAAWWAGGAKLDRPLPPATETALLVQGNVDPFGRARGEIESEVDVYRRLTHEAFATSEADPPTFVIWPEGAAGGEPLEDARGRAARASIQASAPESTFIVGNGVLDGGRLFNSAYGLSDGSILERYDKRVLVPFGERWPLIETAAPLYRGVFGLMGLPLLLSTSPGDAFDPLATPGGPVAAYICYESVFPRVQREMVRRGARVLVNITNDAWFARGNGARQHYDMGRMRAIETRRYLLRAGNDGITGVVDPRGRTVAEFERGVAGSLLAPFSFVDEITPYVRYGGLFMPILTTVVAGLALAGLLRRG